MPSPLKINASALRRSRIHRGYSIRLLAEKAGLNKNTVWQLENGIRGALVSSVAAIADALSIDIAELLEPEEDAA